jgi:hypothetical protein
MPIAKSCVSPEIPLFKSNLHSSNPDEVQLMWETAPVRMPFMPAGFERAVAETEPDAQNEEDQ